MIEFVITLMSLAALGAVVWTLLQLLQVGPLTEQLRVLNATVLDLRKRVRQLEERKVVVESPRVILAKAEPTTPQVASPTTQAPPAQVPPSVDVGFEPATPTYAAPSSTSVLPPLPAKSTPSDGIQILSSAKTEPDLGQKVRDWFAQWNPVVLGGSLLVLLGVVFLVGLAAQNGLFPPALRLVAATVLASVLLGFGWNHRLTRPQWALPLQGTACAILFLVIYGAYRTLHLIPAPLAMGLAVVLLVLTGILAVLQSSQRLAILALGAGFAAPIALSSGNGSHIGLFSYYVLLNLAVVCMVWLRGWRTLLGLAFVATYGIATTWGVLRFAPEHLASCELFLWIFYALFSTATLGFALRPDAAKNGAVSGSLVFGLPLATFGLQSGLVHADPLLLAWTAAGMCLHHLAVGAWVLNRLRTRNEQALRPMAEALLVLGSLLGSLAVPLALSGRWTSLTWAVEGAGLVWLSTRQGRLWNLILGGILLLLATGLHIKNGTFDLVDGFVLALSLLSAARCLDLASLPCGQRALEGRILTLVAWVLLAWDLHSHLPLAEGAENAVWAIYVLLVSVGISVLGQIRPWRWSGFHWTWLPTSALWAILVLQGQGVGTLWGCAAWILGPCVAMFVLDKYRREQDPPPHLRLASETIFLHGLALSLCALAAHWSLALGAIWSSTIAWSCAALLLYAFSQLNPATTPYVAARPLLQRGPLLFPWIASLAAMAFASLFRPGDSEPFPWIPVVNSSDLPAFLAVAVLASLPSSVFGIAPKQHSSAKWAFLGMFGLAWCGTTLARAFHHWGSAPWDFGSLWQVRALQAAWTLLLTAAALGLCWLASRRSFRALWLVGAGLLGAVTLKLLFVDLSGSGTVARIVSFLGAGLLMVGIGYLSPLPPHSQQRSLP